MIAYFFFRFFDFLLKWMPWSALYGLSNFVYFILFRVLRYRVDLVRTHFSTCFPNSDEQWVNQMTKTYYHYLSDILLESIKALHIPASEIQDRYKLVGEDVLRRPELANRNVILVGSHYGNWEFMTRGLPYLIPHEPAGVYRPLSNKRIEAYMAKHRSKDGMWLVPTEKSKPAWTEDRGKPVAYALLADQNPSNPRKSYWIEFLNRETGFTPGAEVYAKRFDYPVVLMLMNRVKRGHYEVSFELLEMNPKETEFGEIMQKYVGALEKRIQNDPPYWLWSHRRWKHKMPEDFTLMKSIK